MPTYVGKTKKDKITGKAIRGSSLFDVKDWTLHDIMLSGHMRTNNHIESYHRNLNDTVGMAHPNLWNFFKVNTVLYYSMTWKIWLNLFFFSGYARSPRQPST